MLRRPVLFAAAVAVGLAGNVHAQGGRSAFTDARFYPYLGCWRSDAADAGHAGALTCVVPVDGSADVDLLSIAAGRVVSRHRLDATGRAHSTDVDGCAGQEKTSWSTLARRVYVRAEYVCSPTGIAGGSATLHAVLPTGEWLEVQSIRSGSGIIVHAERRRDAGVPADLPRDLAAQMPQRRLAVMTARAEAAAPSRSADVIEVMRATDTAVTRLWLQQTGQHFQLSGAEVAAMVRDAVPSSVLQAMMSAPPAYQLGTGVDSNGRSTEAYLNTPGWMPLSVAAKNAYTYGYPYASWAYPSACCASVYVSHTYYVQTPTYYPRETAPRPYYSPYSQVYYSYEPYYPYGYGGYGGGRTPVPVTPPPPRAPVGIRR